MLGHSNTLAYEQWPKADQNALKTDQFEMIFCINGKKVSSNRIETGLSEEDIKALFEQDPKVINALKNKLVKKIIVVKNKLVNAVV